MSQRWRILQSVMLSPGKIGDIAGLLALVAFAVLPFAFLAGLVRSRYSRAGAESSGSGIDTSSMLEDVATVVRGIAVGRSRRERLVARVLPLSGRRRLRAWLDRRGRQVALMDRGAARRARLLVLRRRHA